MRRTSANGQVGHSSFCYITLAAEATMRLIAVVVGRVETLFPSLSDWRDGLHYYVLIFPSFSSVTSGLYVLR